MNRHKEMEKLRDNVAASIKDTEKRLRHLPKGTLQCFRNGDSYKWFKISKDNTDKKRTIRHYIHRDDEELAQSLAYKAFLQAQLRGDKEELRAIEMYLRHCNVKDYADDYLMRSPEHRRLVDAARNSALAKADEEMRDWLSDTMPSVAPRQERRTFMSQAGYMVRSKSEQIIVALLMRYNIPFKYEQRVYASGASIYPDFMIMHPKNHRIFIWEHLGMMDDDKYREHNLWKLGEYAKIGFIPGDNLILTYETKASGFDEVLAEYLILHYLID